MSDSHGEETNLRWMLEQLWKLSGPIDAYVHLGDGVRDFERAEKFIRAHDPEAKMIAVAGNNDFSVNVPETRIERLGGVRFLLTHGHRYHVKRTYDVLDLAARENGCAMALFGHTHSQTLEMHGVPLLNPGSVQNDRMALIDIDSRGDIRPQLLVF